MNKRLIGIGIIILLIFITGIFSIVSVIESPEYLELIRDREQEIYIGAFFQLIMVILYICLIVLITPIIETYNKKLSLYFAISRSISTTFHLVGIILLMLFIPLSKAFLLEVNHVYETIGELLRLGRDLTNHIGVIIPYLVGSIIFYVVLFKEGYIRKWLFILGIIGVFLALLSSILILFNVISLVSIEFALMSLPLALQEFLLAVILIYKGKQSVQV